MPIDLGSVELFMGPADLGAPDDLEAAIVEFIDGARKTLEVAVQELESEPIARALIAAKKRGVKVRMILESDYLIATRSHPDPFASVGSNEPNRLLFCALLRASRRPPESAGRSAPAPARSPSGWDGSRPPARAPRSRPGEGPRSGSGRWRR